MVKYLYPMGRVDTNNHEHIYTERESRDLGTRTVRQTRGKDDRRVGANVVNCTPNARR